MPASTTSDIAYWADRPIDDLAHAYNADRARCIEAIGIYRFGQSRWARAVFNAAQSISAKERSMV